MKRLKSFVSSYMTTINNNNNKDKPEEIIPFQNFHDRVPFEVVMIIIGFLDFRELSRVRLTCRRWKNVAEDDALWENMCLKRWPDDFIWIDTAMLTKHRSWRWLYECRHVQYVQPATPHGSRSKLSIGIGREKEPQLVQYTLSPASMEELDEGEGNKPAQVIRASQGPGSGKDSGGWDEVESYVGELRASDRVRHGYGIGVYQAYRKERFEGWWKNGKRYKGKNHYLNPGDTYVGTFTDGVLTGTGEYTWANKNKYIGDFANSKKHGKGTVLWNNGDSYHGDYVNDHRHGKGEYTWNNGNKYIGEYENDKQKGRGLYIWNDGNRYEGDFVDYERHGKGVFIWSNGSRYEGDFHHNKRTGKGIYRWPDGHVYVGDFLNDLRTGKGVVTWGKGPRCGDRYEGDFWQGEREGYGTYLFANGNRYEGQFKKSAACGRGTLYYAATGNRFEGFFSEDKPQVGTMYYANIKDGAVYEGEVSRDGKRHGSGVLYADRERTVVIHRGRFVNDEPVVATVLGDGIGGSSSGLGAKEAESRGGDAQQQQQQQPQQQQQQQQRVNSIADGADELAVGVCAISLSSPTSSEVAELPDTPEGAAAVDDDDDDAATDSDHYTKSPMLPTTTTTTTTNLALSADGSLASDTNTDS